MASNPAPPSRVKTRSPATQTVKPQPSAPVRLKTVVRRLPPNLPEPVFWQTVEPWVSEESVSWKVFYPGKLRKKLNKENIPSRAYILFKNEESLASFSRGYDGHLFRDKQGNESQAVVEFAPNQKVPPEKKKADSRHATIQQDEDYLSFVAALQNPQPKTAEVDVEALLAATQTPDEPKMTPLLAALRDQKAAAHEKKLAASEAAKAHSRKVAAAAAAASALKAEGEEVSQPAAKKGRKGKGSHHAGASTSSTAPNAASTSAKPGKTSGASRNRSANAAGNTTGPSSSVASGATASSASKEPPAQGADETSQKRNRPILGLQSRHLKAALNGAGVTVLQSQPSTSSTSGGPPAPVAEHAGRASGGPRGGAGGGGGGEKHNEKDGSAKNAGGRGGKERSRSRHHPGGNASSQPGVGRGMETTPRILSREDSVTAVLNTGDVSARDRPAAGGSHETGSSRGRNRRGRGQP